MALLCQSDITQSDITKSDTTQSDIIQSDITQSDITQLDITQSDIIQSDITQSDITQSDITQSDIIQSNITQSDITQLDITQSDITQSEITPQKGEQSNLSIFQKVQSTDNFLTRLPTNLNPETRNSLILYGQLAALLHLYFRLYWYIATSTLSVRNLPQMLKRSFRPAPTS